MTSDEGRLRGSARRRSKSIRTSSGPSAWHSCGSLWSADDWLLFPRGLRDEFCHRLDSLVGETLADDQVVDDLGSALERDAHRSLGQGTEVVHHRKGDPATSELEHQFPTGG